MPMRNPAHAAVPRPRGGRTPGTVLAALCALLTATSATAGGEGGDAAKGETVVRNVCVTCHKLPDGTGNAVGPPLVETVPADGWSAATVKDNINQPHHASAKAQVDASAHADVAAYLNQLR